MVSYEVTDITSTFYNVGGERMLTILSCIELLEFKDNAENWIYVNVDFDEIVHEG